MVQVKLNNECPMVITYEITNLGSVSHFLAPKMSDEQ